MAQDQTSFDLDDIQTDYRALHHNIVNRVAKNHELARVLFKEEPQLVRIWWRSSKELIECAKEFGDK